MKRRAKALDRNERSSEEADVRREREREREGER